MEAFLKSLILFGGFGLGVLALGLVGSLIQLGVERLQGKPPSRDLPMRKLLQEQLDARGGRQPGEGRQAPRYEQRHHLKQPRPEPQPERPARRRKSSMKRT